MRGLDKLHPEVRAKAERLQALCRENGLPLLITETWRSEEEQSALYAKGRTAPGKVVTNCKYPYSPHCWGAAFDFCRNVRGREYETTDGFFEKVGRLGKSVGLFWGGDFKTFKDMPHFEDPAFVVNNSVRTLIEKWGMPNAFRDSWANEEPAEAKPSVVMEPLSIPAAEAASGAWEWAEQNGLTEGIDKRAPVTGEAIINLLYRYNEIKQP